MRRKQRRKMARQSPVVPAHICEAEVIPGLEAFARQELKQRSGIEIHESPRPNSGAVTFRYSGSLVKLTELRTVQAVYLVQRYDIPRPRALLGDQHFRALNHQIDLVRSLSSTSTFTTMHLSAAGSETSVLRRLRSELSVKTKLDDDNEQGDLLIRLRRTADGSAWETLVRLTPRPLATRSWRVCNMEGALNATVAHVMGRLSNPNPAQHYVNLCCGSGSLLIERALQGQAAQITGIDNDPHALTCAQANTTAADLNRRVKLVRGDATRIPLSAAQVDAVVADLPFGQLVGSHAENEKLYPAVLEEAARITRADGLFVLITHEMRLISRLLHSPTTWWLEREQMITLRGLHPRIYVLRRSTR